jgi:integrase
MRSYTLQKFRGGWAFATYEDGERIGRRQIPAANATEAAEQFERLKAEYERPEKTTVAIIWDGFAAAMSGRPIATTMGFERKSVIAHFGDMDPTRITEKTCLDYAEKRRSAGRKDGTIWTELGHLRTALKWAEKTQLISRASAIVRPTKPDPKNRYLTKKEAEKLLAAATMPHVRLFIILAIATAARRSALLDLTWEQVDLAKGQIRLHKDELASRRKGRATVPINNILRAALQEAKKGARTKFVIEWAGEPVRSVRKGIENAAVRAKIAEVTPHVFRHTAAVWMAEDGRPMSEIAQFLGHADSRITERVYARYSPKHLRRAAKALEFGKFAR